MLKKPLFFRYYKTPTGQRTIQIMPQLVQESVQHINQLMLPKI
ncbi:DUF2059 domain-containing protein [Gloeothece verrucosa]